MKTIFRYTNIAVLTAAIFAVGAVAGFAQDPCAEPEVQTALGDKFRAEYPLKDIAGRKKAIETGEQFLAKYGACESAKELAEYLKTTLPKMKTNLKNVEEGTAKAALLTRFDNGLKSKNWDEVYAAGKEIVQKYPDEFRAAELVLGSIGLDETAKDPRVTKYNEDTLRYAKMSIADLEGGKEFKTFGVNPFTYKNKDDALGWMNYTIGYIYVFDKNDKKQGLSYLYKATQLNSDTKSNPIVFQSIGSYYFDEVKRLAGEVTVLEKKQDPAATPEAAKALVDEIKAKVALVNGTAEAGIDAYARAFNLAKTDPVKYKKEYADTLNKAIQGLYNVRFGKMDGLDTFVANVVKKPLPNPTNPVTPISDPEPVAPVTTPGGSTATTTMPVTTTPAATVKPATTTVKPATTTVTKPATPPATKPAVPTKPQAVVKKKVVKKRGA